MLQTIQEKTTAWWEENTTRKFDTSSIEVVLSVLGKFDDSVGGEITSSVRIMTYW